MSPKYGDLLFTISVTGAKRLGIFLYKFQDDHVHRLSVVYSSGIENINTNLLEDWFVVQRYIGKK